MTRLKVSGKMRAATKSVPVWEMAECDSEQSTIKPPIVYAVNIMSHT